MMTTNQNNTVGLYYGTWYLEPDKSFSSVEGLHYSPTCPMLSHQILLKNEVICASDAIVTLIVLNC